MWWDPIELDDFSGAILNFIHAGSNLLLQNTEMLIIHMIYSLISSNIKLPAESTVSYSIYTSSVI